MANSSAAKLKKWQIINKSIAFKTPWFKIRKQRMRTPKGVELDYFIHDGNDSVICVCVSDDNRVLVEKQFRAPIEKFSIDYPAGRMEKDDKSTEAAMRRELREEAGFIARSIQKLGIIDKEPGFSSTRMHVFLAKGTIDVPATPDETESIVLKFVTPGEVLKMIDTKKMTCAFCLSATLLAFKKLGWLKSELKVK
jgi:ADP-ribose pyrophosphatase